MKNQFKDLEDYGIIGNLETCALIGADGSVDWLCLPYLESPSVFASLLDLRRGGSFRITPIEKYRAVQEYVGETNVLKTTFHTPLGIASVTDFMPVKTIEDRDYTSMLFRKVEWLKKGELELELDFRPRFEYGRSVPVMEPVEGGVIARSRNESIFLHSSVDLHLHEEGARARVRSRERTAAWFVLQYNNHKVFSNEQYEQFLQRTLDFWEKWAHACEGPDCLFAGPWHDLVTRSGLVLKLLTNSDNGAIAASATTSLPEWIGGVRNWDYRFSWIRDSAFTVQALFHIGHPDDARRFSKWLHDIVAEARSASQLKILYPLRGEPDLTEKVLDHLNGYRDSQPVRIGNVAAGQRQLDIFGEFVNSLYDTTRYGQDIRKPAWGMVKEIADYVATAWDQPDSGIWEDRTGPKHYIYSKLMCWVALDRAIRIAETKRFDGKLEDWRSARHAVAQAITDKGFDRTMNSFIRSFGSRELDATGLLIPIMGFLPFDDYRVQGTIDAVMKHLMKEDGLVARYNADDGLPGKEGTFILCSFWLVMSLSLSGRIYEAEHHFMSLLRYVSPLGLISEEVDPESGRLLGNMPQAFGHIGLINAALNIGIARGRQHRGPKPIGHEEHEHKKAA